MLDFSEACEKYRLLDVPGCIADNELAWLYKTATSMPAGSTIVEVGVWRGKSTCAILAGCAEVSTEQTVYCIDTFAAYPAMPPRFRAEVEKVGGYEGLREEFEGNIESRGLPMPRILCADSRARATADQIKEQIDWVHLDGDHTYEAVVADIRNWRRVLGPAGLLSGHDFDIWWPSVIRAVIEQVPSAIYGPGMLWHTETPHVADRRQVAGRNIVHLGRLVAGLCQRMARSLVEGDPRA